MKQPTGEAIRTSLTLIEAVVLGLLLDQPRHGFAVKKELEPGAEIGRIFTAKPPVVYRALGTLTQKNFLTGGPVEPSPEGPNREVKLVSEAGRSAFDAWLARPVAHVRDVRVEFLVKLALHFRLGRDPLPLVRRQVAALEPIDQAHQEASISKESTFEDVLNVWRYENSNAAMRFLSQVLQSLEDDA